MALLQESLTCPVLCRLLLGCPSFLLVRLSSLQVNGGDHALHEFVATLGVEKLPYFQFYRCGEILSQFAANLSKIGQLRAEIEMYKARALQHGRSIVSQS